MCGSSTTQETKIPDKTPEELRMDAILSDVVIPQIFEDLGYELNEQEVRVPKNPERLSRLETERDELRQQLNDLESQPRAGVIVDQRRRQQEDALRRELNAVETDLATERENVQVSFEFDPIMNEIGEKRRLLQDQSLDAQIESNQLLMQNFRDLLNGNIEVSESQEQFIQENLGAIREPVNRLLDAAQREFENTGVAIGEQITNLEQTIRDTGISVGAALNAVDGEIDTTQASVSEALNNVKNVIGESGDAARQALEQSFAIRSLLTKRDMEDQFIQNRRAVAEQATLLGRSAMDPQFQLQLQERNSRLIENAQLELAEREALQRVGLELDLGGRLENVALKEAANVESAGLRREGVETNRVNLADQTGQRLEGAAEQRVGVAERTGAGREGVAGQRAALEEQIQSSAANLRRDFGVGIPSEAVGMGIDVAGFQSALDSQRIANTQAAGAVASGGAANLRADRFAQPTTTTTTSGDPFGTILGVAGVGAEIASQF